MVTHLSHQKARRWFSMLGGAAGAPRCEDLGQVHLPGLNGKGNDGRDLLIWINKKPMGICIGDHVVVATGTYETL